MILINNNPVKYVDPRGDFVFTAIGSALLQGIGTDIGVILDGACWGAAGAVVNTTVQAVNIATGKQDAFGFESFGQFCR